MKNEQFLVFNDFIRETDKLLTELGYSEQSKKDMIIAFTKIETLDRIHIVGKVGESTGKVTSAAIITNKKF